MNIIEKHQEQMKIIKGIEKINLDQVLENAEKIIRKWNKDKISREISISAKLETNIQDILNDFTEIYDKLHYIKKVFIYDKKYSNGFVKKCVVNALKSSKYKQYINSLIAELNQNKGKLLKDYSYTMDYIMWHDISANRIEIIKTIDTFSEILGIIIINLMENNTCELNDLIFVGTFLERRLYQLYCLYGHYLDDIGNLNEYLNNLKYFEKLDNAFKNLVHCIHERSCK